MIISTLLEYRERTDRVEGEIDADSSGSQRRNQLMRSYIWI
jgi:hypothetical protein